MFVNIILWCIMLLHLVKRIPVGVNLGPGAIGNKVSQTPYTGRSTLLPSLHGERLPNSSLSIFANSFKGFQIATFGGRRRSLSHQLTAYHLFLPSNFTRNGRRVSYFVMSVPGKLKPEIADCCFRSRCFYFLALPGKRPVVVIFHATKIRGIF